MVPAALNALQTGENPVGNCRLNMLLIITDSRFIGESGMAFWDEIYLTLGLLLEELICLRHHLVAFESPFSFLAAESTNSSVRCVGRRFAQEPGLYLGPKHLEIFAPSLLDRDSKAT